MPTLHWLTRDEDVRAAQAVPYRLLEEAPELGAGARDTGNMLIQGDNLQALKSLLPFYAGRVKCIYIDPPFNTGQAFENYDDNLEHSIWLGLMYARFELLRELLSEDGTIAVHLDDEEFAYAITILDEVFGRSNRINVCTFKQGAAVGHKAINPGVVTVTNFVILYAKDKDGGWKPNRVFTGRERDKRYSSFIENFDDGYEQWKLIPLNKAFAAQFHETTTQTKKRLGLVKFEREISNFVLQNAHRVVQPVPPDYEGVGQDTRDLIDESKTDPSRVYLQERKGFSDIYMRSGKRWLFYKDKLKKIDGRLVAGEPLTNLWDDLLSNNLHNEGGVSFPKGKKPESLVKRVLELFTKPGSLVLDSFLGSGTTAAVAHKMGRRYIGIEMGEHAVTHCKPRLEKVIAGEQGGISENVGWKGGGGFRFYRLGPEVFDAEGRIRPDISFPVLAAHIWFSETNTPWTPKHHFARREASSDMEVAPRDPHDFYDFGPYRPASPQYLESVVPEQVNALIAKRQASTNPFLGFHNGRAYALLYNGVLGDKRPQGGNVLTRATLVLIRERIAAKDAQFAGPLTAYGEQSRLGETTLAREGVTFKQTPYDVKARR